MVNSKNTSSELFNEFLNEEALKPNQQVEVALEIIKPETIKYKLAVAVPATADEIKSQWRAIRNFYRSGEIPRGSESTGLSPVLLAPLLRLEEFDTDYPVFLSEDNKVAHGSFAALLFGTFEKLFNEKEAGFLRRSLPRIQSFVRKYVAEAGHFCILTDALQAAFRDLSTIKIKGEDQVNFSKDIEKLKDHLPASGKLLGFSEVGAIRLLGHLLKYHSLEKKNEFIAAVHTLKSGLSDLLSVENAGRSTEKSSGWQIADSLIEFNKLDTLRPERASESMSAKRYERIASCIKILDGAESLVMKYGSLVFISNNLSAHADGHWKELLQGLEVRIAPSNESCSAAAHGFKLQMAGLTKLMAAVRMADLEIKGKYDEDIHGDFFKRFNWHYFTEEEMALCPPVVLIEETHNLLGRELPHFSSLIASNVPVKVLAQNSLTPFTLKVDGSEEELPLVEEELSSFTISHRSAFTAQSALHDPVDLVKGIESGLASATPALFHVLIPSGVTNSTSENFISISSAVEGRQFPLFRYYATEEKWGSRFDISANPQADRGWPVYTLDISHDTQATEQLELAFTFADYYALDASHHKHLFLVPPSCWSDDLIPLSLYLELATDQLYAKVPFIWLLDEDNTLHKAAVPYALVIAAKERLDFWHFIQELGGINSFHVEQAVARTRKEMQAQKEKEIAELQSRFESDIEKVRTAAAGEAMERLAGILLDLDSMAPLPAGPKISKPAVATESAAIKAVEEVSVKTEAVAQPAEISNEAWVESYRCTSCNECTDKYPRAFKYNSEKQAYIDDPTTVTFAQLVKAAEACPAKCIHPGMPLNPNEPGLEELIAKAKPFN